MHIYSPHFLEEFPRVKNARIYDHSFTFVSQVLYGNLIQKTYGVFAPGGKDSPHDLYKVERSTNKLVRLCSCDFDWVKSKTYIAGSNYQFGGPRNYHDAYANELTVTVMTKLDSDADHEARVVSLNTRFNDEEPDDAFDRQPDRDEMCREVKRVIRILK